MSAGSSPFSIPHEDIEALCTSRGFQIIRNYLASNAENAFCAEHHDCDDERKQTWLLQRDILHAMIMPIVQLFNRASALAEAALCSSRPEDLELAFREDARSAFLWLQCFIADENDWCNTRGCPACTTLETLTTDPHIRLAITAALLSEHPSPSSLTLPPFSFFLPTVATALAADPFWGSHAFGPLLDRAALLAAGIQTMIAQCAQLEALVTTPTLSPVEPDAEPRLLTPATTGAVGTGIGMKVRKGRMAKRQLRLRTEEQEMAARIVWQCWGRVALSGALNAEQKSAVKSFGSMRGRGGGRTSGHKRALSL
ncbi:hypothetical protein M501DRAFT_944976 [Patellaria atrata CBS 101060]|uniref:Uncharacterized protein n=1 Tax=Patellaria atrata CBS 101060 TaxID=1346257 RepID=A0A9P4VIH6_9PEZI|nr:hypothetical protein M501DRAFT_944976 [Patellaria atrata CBS 101060]